MRNHGNEHQPGFIRRLELLWRHRIAYPFLQYILRNETIHLPVDLSSLRSVLILRYDRLGDMIVTTPIFRNLKQHYPGLRIGVFASRLNAEMIRHNPNVDEIYVLHSNWLRLFGEIRRARRDGYDLVLNFIFNRTSTGGLLANLIAPRGIKIGQGDDKYRFYFNHLLKLTRTSEHMVETLAYFLAQSTGFQIDSGSLGFEISVGPEESAAVERFLSAHELRSRIDAGNGPRFVIFNVSATDEVRKLSMNQVHSLARHLASRTDHATVVIAAPGDSPAARDIVAEIHAKNVIFFPEQGSVPLLQVASIIGSAAAVITPDTGIIHFASAMKTPVLAFYTPMQGMHEWLPFQVPHAILAADPKTPVSAIPEVRLFKATDDFLETYVR